jgi:hypothetical protein
MCEYRSGIATLVDDVVTVYTLPGNDSHEDIRERHGIRDGCTDYRQAPVELVPTTLWDYDTYQLDWDGRRPEWADDAVADQVREYLLRVCRADDLTKWGGDLHLGKLTSLPAGAKLSAGGNLYLGKLTSLPASAKLSPGGNLDLGSLTSLPAGARVTAKHTYLRAAE